MLRRSLRHTRITDLVQNGYSIGEVQARSGHSFSQTTNGYTELAVENPWTLEIYCAENGIDLMAVIEA
jgi:integrase